MPLTYSRIEEQLTDALPEIRPAAERYWREEGPEGQDSGAYIFIEDLFAKYLGILLAMDPSTSRDHWLRRAFDFVEEMMASSDDNIVNVATIGIFEGRELWWLASAAPFLGHRTMEVLDRFQPEWRQHAASTDRPTDRERRDIFDLYGVREVIANSEQRRADSEE
jgi:hypothetical protein